MAEPSSQPVPARSGWRALLAGLRRGFHPPLLAAWVMALWLPAALATVPAAIWLYLQTARAPDAAALAADANFLASALSGLRGEGPFLAAAAVAALLSALLLSPWLNGMILAQARAGERLRLGRLLRAGLGEYLRMARMLLLSAVLLALALGAGVLATWGLEAVLLRFTPAGDALAATQAGWLLPVALALLAHVTIEAGRGWLGAEPAMRSVCRAWRQGLRLLWRRPGATLAVYSGTSTTGIGIALGFLYLRALAGTEGWLAWLAAWACAQCAVAAMAWGRSARLHGLADLAAAQRSVDDAAPKRARARR